MREENDALRLQFEAITLNPTLRRYESEVDETSVFDDDYPESIVSSATKMNANQSVYSQSIGSGKVLNQPIRIYQLCCGIMQLVISYTDKY